MRETAWNEREKVPCKSREEALLAAFEVGRANLACPKEFVDTDGGYFAVCGMEYRYPAASPHPQENCIHCRHAKLVDGKVSEACAGCGPDLLHFEQAEAIA